MINSKTGEILASSYAKRLIERWTAEEVIAIKRDLFRAQSSMKRASVMAK
jgi:hypothetical protein